MPLFGKKKATGADDELEVMDKTENDKSEINVNKRNPFAHLKRKARVMFKLRLKRKSSDGDESEPIPELDDLGSSGKKEKKPKKEKPPKEKKEKKEKPPKEKKPKKEKKDSDAEPSADGDDNGDTTIKPIIWIIVAACAVIIGVVAFFIFNSTLNQPSVEEQLIEANELLVKEKYSKAFKIYEKLLKEDETLVDAYLGAADALHKNDQSDRALAKLTLALPLTNDDPRILAKIDEIENPPPEPEKPQDDEKGEESEADAESSGGEEASEGEGEDSEEKIAETVIVPASSAVTFADPEFEKMVRLALNKPEAEQVTHGDVTAITSLKILGNTHAAASGGAEADANNTLTSINRIDSYTIRGVTYTERGTIRSLDDLKHFTGLKKLVVAYNSVTDLNGLAELKNLNTLGLYCNNISDIAPLSKLESLEYLYIYNNSISDVAPLASLTKMRQLWLNDNNISDISALKDLTALRELFLNHNNVQSISAVSGMTSLSTLFFDNNQVTDISAVKDLQSLNEVSFLNNPVGDTSPASNISRVNQPYY